MSESPNIPKCPACNYDTSATQGSQCPECGCDLAVEKARRANPRPVWWIISCYAIGTFWLAAGAFIADSVSQHYHPSNSPERLLVLVPAAICGTVGFACWKKRDRLRYDWLRSYQLAAVGALLVSVPTTCFVAIALFKAI